MAGLQGGGGGGREEKGRGAGEAGDAGIKLITQQSTQCHRKGLPQDLDVRHTLFTRSLIARITLTAVHVGREREAARGGGGVV